MSPARHALSLLSLAWVCACASDGTDPFGGQTGSELPPCELITTVTLASDEPSPLGFSADEVLDFAAGTHMAPLRWRSGDGTDLSLEITPNGPAHFEGRKQGAQMEGPAIANQCVDAVVMPVRLVLSSADRRISDDLGANLKAVSTDQITLFTRLSSGAVQDDLSGLDASEFAGIDYFLDIELAPGTFAGSLTAQATKLDDGSASATNVELGSW